MANTTKMPWFGEYERHARVAPGFLALLPIAIAGAAVGLRENPVVSGVVGLLIVAGGPLLLSGIVRRLGLALQERLYTNWGGSVTTSLLRLRSASNNSTLRERRRQALERVSGLTLASRESEEQDSKSADDLIEAAVGVLREKTRDQQQFQLVFSENKNYGFERNLLAVRPLGVLSSAIGVLGLGAIIVLALADVVDGAWPELSVGIAIDLSLLTTWILYPTEARVRQAAEKYANAVLDAASVV